MEAQIDMQTSPPEVPAISRAELQSRLKDSSLTIVDVLPAESYTAGHIPGAISLPFEKIASDAKQILPDPGAEIALYCGKFT
jgi:rhodanese-related sulfurtransferase